MHVNTPLIVLLYECDLLFSVSSGYRLAIVKRIPAFK